MMFNKIPAHIFWPGMVVSFLVMTVAIQMGLLMAARSDQGAQIEADYYERSLEWDQLQALRARSQALGWKVELRFPTEGGDQTGQAVEVVVTDRDQVPVEGLDGVLELRRPSRAGVQSAETLTPVPGKPGVYRASAAINAPGLWDFSVKAHKGSQEFLAELRQELGT